MPASGESVTLRKSPQCESFQNGNIQGKGRGCRVQDRPLTDTVLSAEVLPVLPPQSTVLVAVHIAIGIDSWYDSECESLQGKCCFGVAGCCG